MKIIEALKEIPLIEKKVQKNNEDIKKYSSYCTKIGLSFKDKNEQEKQVIGLIQSNIDLCNRRLDLKRLLTKTNATLTLKIENKELTIVEWLEYLNKVSHFLKNTFTSLNNGNGVQQMQQGGGLSGNDAEKILIVTCFDEKFKNSKLEEVETITGKITSSLEIFNATTDLVV